jgi:hypothetical protein
LEEQDTIDVMLDDDENTYVVVCEDWVPNDEES